MRSIEQVILRALKYSYKDKRSEMMAMERHNSNHVVEFGDIEIVKMKLELMQFVKKMQSEGFLSSLNCEELSIGLESEKLNTEGETRHLQS